MIDLSELRLAQDFLPILSAGVCARRVSTRVFGLTYYKLRISYWQLTFLNGFGMVNGGVLALYSQKSGGFLLHLDCFDCNPTVSTEVAHSRFDDAITDTQISQMYHRF